MGCIAGAPARGVLVSRGRCCGRCGRPSTSFFVTRRPGGGRWPSCTTGSDVRRSGSRTAPLPVIVVAALLAHAEDVALYERGSFVPDWTSSLAERLLRSPRGLEVRRCRIVGARREIIVDLASILPSQPASQPASQPDLRCCTSYAGWCGACSPFRRTLAARAGSTPQHGGFGTRWSRPREPAQLLFDDLPAACGCSSIGAEPIGREQRERFTESLWAALDGIERAYSALLDRTRLSIARELSLPEAPAELAAELRSRSRRIREITVDPSLAGFVLRAAAERHSILTTC